LSYIFGQLFTSLPKDSRAYLKGQLDLPHLIDMAPATNEEQFKFLISCIRYSNNGKVINNGFDIVFPLTYSKVEFGEVAKECNIVSKGAA
jgi:hypothetical protein